MGEKKAYDIHERIFQFVVELIKFVQKLPRTSVNQTVVPQIINSATSMGANDQEADGSATRKEFIHRYSIVRKEGKETVFWLRLIGETSDTRFQKRSRELQDEGNEIISIVSSIINKTSQRVSRKRR